MAATGPDPSPKSGLAIPQAKRAARAGVSRRWLIAMESGRPTMAAGKVFRTLEALGFELTVTPYDPRPSCQSDDRT